MSLKSELEPPPVQASAPTGFESGDDPLAIVRQRRARRVHTKSLAFRLTAWYAVTSFILVFIATLLLYWALQSALRDVEDQFLTAKVSTLRSLLRGPAASYTFGLQEEVEQTWAPRQYASVRVRVLDGTGKVRFESPGMSTLIGESAFPAPQPVTADDHDALNAVNVSTPAGALRIAAAQVPAPTSGQSPWTLQLALDTGPQVALLSEYRKRLWLLLGVALIVCVALGDRIARQGIRPVRIIAQEVAGIRSTTLHTRLDSAGLPAELSVLADTFNTVLDRLEESFDRLSRFSADIAHELRTPIHNLRGTSEVTLAKPRTNEEYREALGSCLEESARLARIIDSLLFLARAENPHMQIQRERVSIAREVTTLREFFEPAALDRGVTLTTRCDSALFSEVDRILFQRAVSNLVSNALAYTPSEGTITVEAREANGRLRVDVVDTGCGIPAEHLPRLFDRLYRADPSRNPTGGNLGLGLSIVRSIAVLHGGSVAVDSKVGVGTQVTLWLGPAWEESPRKGR